MSWFLSTIKSMFTAPGWVVAQRNDEEVIAMLPDESQIIFYHGPPGNWIGKTKDPALRDDIFEEFGIDRFDLNNWFFVIG